MKKKTIIIIVLLYTCMNLFAQQDPHLSQNMFSQLAFNPGSAGSNDKINVTALSRQQWVGLGTDNGAPMTNLFLFDAAMNPFGINSGIGLSFIGDELGFNQDFALNLNLAYKWKFDNSTLGIGASGGIINRSLDAQWTNITSPIHTDPSADPAVPESQSEMAIDFGFGLYYTTGKLYVGLSSTHLTEPEFEYTKGSPSLKRHYYITAGYNVGFANPSFDFLPSVLVISDGTTSILSVNTTVAYNKKIWGGVSLRTDNSVTGMLGIELFNWIKIGYSYDYSFSEFSNLGGTHEIMMGFSFDAKVDRSPRQYKSVRYL